MPVDLSRKPLGGKSYGSIPHLPGSRRGPADYGCHEGQARIATEATRDRHDTVIVQEKLDGSNVGVSLIGGEVVALSRAGYLAATSPYEQHHRFAEWVKANEHRFRDLLTEGERICGEWLIQAHGTRYKLPHEPFVAFDLMTGKKRATFNEVRDRLAGRFVMPNLLAVGPPVSVESVLAKLDAVSGHGAIDPVEGAVWRVERKGVVDFICKYVRHDKADGKYLPELSGQPAVMNEWPAESAHN